MRILIVDDSRTMRTILTRMVSELGHTDIDQAEHGKNALEQMAEHVPEVALVDWNMPVMGGLEFITTVRERREYDRVKVLVVTSESNPRIVYEALKAGADEYAMKPITADIIEAKLEMMGLVS